MKISEYVSTDYKEFGLYTVENRAIPQLMDGLKPVQRFVLYSGYRMAKNKSDKVAAIGSSVAQYGHHHGETSACNALVLMTAKYNNNLPLFDGDGHFGTRLDNCSAAPRYIFSKLAKNIDKIFMDTELAPSHPDQEHIPPKHYLPIVPLALINGVKGIAVAVATNIPPHDAKSVIDYLIAKAEGKNLPKIKPHYPQFTGTVTYGDGCYICLGKFERTGKTHLTITELPPNYDVDGYKRVLDKLEERGIISCYDDASADDSFRFEITLKKGLGNLSDDEIISTFKLRWVDNLNLTVILQDRLVEYECSLTGIQKMLDDFYNERIEKINERIEKEIGRLKHLVNWYESYFRFLQDIISRKLILDRFESDEALIKTIEGYGFTNDEAVKLSNLPVRKFTKKSMEEAKKEHIDILQKLEYYTKTTKEKEYVKNLNELLETLK